MNDETRELLSRVMNEGIPVRVYVLLDDDPDQVDAIVALDQAFHEMPAADRAKILRNAACACIRTALSVSPAGVEGELETIEAMVQNMLPGVKLLGTGKVDEDGNVKD